MKRYLPTSIFQLTLTGFTLVVLPLIIALAVTVHQVDNMSQLGLRTVFNSASSVQNSRRLVELVTAMERSARQYQVLGDASLFQLYQDKHAEFELVAIEMSLSEPSPAVQSQLLELKQRENDLYQQIVNTHNNPDEYVSTLEGFSNVSALARPLLVDISNRIGDEAKEMHSHADRIKQQLLFMSTALILVTVTLTAVFTVLITRPLEQINQAIRRMGSEGFNEPVTVTGPQDLRELGDRLEWLRARLVDLENQKVNFLRQISHDLKTPLSAIREGSELLADHSLGTLNKEQAEVAYILTDSSIRLQELIENLLHFDVSQLPATQKDIATTSVDDTIQQVIKDQELSLRSASLNLELDLKPALVNASREQLRMVFDNLLSNAIKYSPENSRLCINMLLDDDRVMVDFIDEGPGINPLEQNHIFSAYFQGDSNHNGRIKGTGLGLTIAQEFISLVDGTIEVLQDTKIGAHFRVSLPLATAHE